MQWIMTGIRIIIALLSIAAGIAKLMQMPQELAFLQAIGFGPIAVSLLGITQIIGGKLLLFGRFRFAGALTTTTTFLVSAVAVFAAGNAMFAAISMLPVLLAVFIAVQSRRTT